MSNQRKRIGLLLTVSIVISILMIPAVGQCLSVSGRVVNIAANGSKIGIEKIFIALYPWEYAKKNGLTAVPHADVTDQYGNFMVQDVVLDTDYLLLFSTHALAGEAKYLDFFYGKKEGSASYSTETKMDLLTAPRIRFSSSNPPADPFNMGDITLPKGFYIRGYIKNPNGQAIPKAAIELFQDVDGVPTAMPYPLFRVVETYVTPEATYNFRMGGLRPGGKYYLRVVPNNIKQSDSIGYLEDFYTTTGTEDPRPFQMPSTYSETDQDAGELRLKKGGKVWGYLKDNTGQPIRHGILQVQAYHSENQLVSSIASYYHDPNYGIFFNTDAVPLHDRYYWGLHNFNYYSDGKYELKGFPYEEKDFYLSVVEMTQPGVEKKYATPLMYNAVYSQKSAQSMSVDGEGNEKRVDFILQPGGFIKGTVSFHTLPSAAAQKTMAIDPNVLDKLLLYIDAYRVEEGTISPFGPGSSLGQGSYSISGLPAGDYMIRAYDYSGYRLYIEKYYNDKAIYLNADSITLGSGETVTGKDISLDLGGLLSGRVTDPQGASLAQMPAVAYQINPGSPINGYYYLSSDGTVFSQFLSQTDPNGRFYIWGLPAGSYSVFVTGGVLDSSKAYLPQYYAPSIGGSILANDAETQSVGVNSTDFTALSAIDLYLAGTNAGGIISGTIYVGADTNIVISSQGFYLYLYDAETKVAHYSPSYRLDPNHITANSILYSILAPRDGAYILGVNDIAGKVIPHYYRSAQTTVDPDMAGHIIIDHTDPGKRFLSGINITLSQKGGEISGKAIGTDGAGVSGLVVYARQQVLEGPDKGTWKSIGSATTGTDGQVTLKGFSIGTYVFSLYDPNFEYAACYYHPSQDVYKPENAFQWTYEINSTSQPPFLTFNLKKGGRITGKVNSGVTSSQIYAFLDEGGTKTGGYSAVADPNFNFTLKGLIPGEYILYCKDLGLDFLPAYYKSSGTTIDPNSADKITVVTGVTYPVGTINFSQAGAGMEGHVYKDLGGGAKEAMPYMYLFLYRISLKDNPWSAEPEMYAQTDPNGFYSLKGIAVGEYTIMTFGTQYRPISTALSVKAADLGNTRTGQDITFPADWVNKKFEKELVLEKGLNLIAFPTLIPPFITGYPSPSFLQDLAMTTGRTILGLKGYFAAEREWRSTSFGNADLEGAFLTGSLGNSFYLRNGQGYLCYSGEEKDVAFAFYPGQSPLWLFAGTNLVGNVPVDPNSAALGDPNLISNTAFTNRKMLRHLTKDAALSIQTLKARPGKWQATYWMFGRPCGPEFIIDDSMGYLIGMKKDLPNWYPTK